jgi:hypothetical protein
VSGWDRKDPDEWGNPGRACVNGIIISGLFWFILWFGYLWVTR